MRSVVLALWLAAGCTASQARRAHTGSEIVLAGGLVAMMATLGAAEVVPSHRGDLARAAVVFVPISILSALLYAATDVMLGPSPPPSTARDRAWATAYQLARQAKHAARVHDCAEVQAIEPRVRELDADVYRRFLRDDIIRTCLGPPP